MQRGNKETSSRNIENYCHGNVIYYIYIYSKIMLFDFYLSAMNINFDISYSYFSTTYPCAVYFFSSHTHTHTHLEYYLFKRNVNNVFFCRGCCCYCCCCLLCKLYSSKLAKILLDNTRAPRLVGISHFFGKSLQDS